MDKNLKSIIVKYIDLLLDPNNPRFAKHKDELVSEDEFEINQEETYRRMIDPRNNFDITELADSIKANGYVGFDRIFVRKINNKYLVIEGNRRIAAIHKLVINKTKLESHVEESFNNIPAIDISGWDSDSIKRILGLRHYDSVKDWPPLPASFNLYKDYMVELNNQLSLEGTKSTNDFVYDAPTVKKIANIYSIKEPDAKKMIYTYRIYLQLHEQLTDREDELRNKYSMIDETLSKPKLREHFEFDPQKGLFGIDGLNLFIDLCFGLDGNPPVINEVARGDSTLRDYDYVLQKGDESDRESVEIGRKETSAVKADVKSRQTKRSLHNTLIQIEEMLKNMRLEDIDVSSITDNDKEIALRLQILLDKLRGAAQKNL